MTEAELAALSWMEIAELWYESDDPRSDQNSWLALMFALVPDLN